MALELSAAAQLEKGCLAYTFSRVEGTDDSKNSKKLLSQLFATSCMFSLQLVSEQVSALMLIKQLGMTL
jgi:hypothetical protein